MPDKLERGAITKPMIKDNTTDAKTNTKKNIPIPNCPITDSPKVFLKISLDRLIEPMTPLFSKIITGIIKKVAKVHAIPINEIISLEIHPSDFLSKVFKTKPTVADAAAHINILLIFLKELLIPSINNGSLPFNLIETQLTIATLKKIDMK